MVYKSKYRGVTWHVTCKKWMVSIWHNNKKINAGYYKYEDENEAAKKYDEEAVRLKGDKAVLNFNYVEKMCEVESCNEKAKGKYKDKIWLCKRHLSQMYQFGKIFSRTAHDLNEIIEYDTYAEIILYNIKNIECGRAIINKHNVDKVKKYKWYLRPDGYVATNNCDDQYVYLHHLILGTDLELYRDHEDRNRLNNLENNLRLANWSDNSINKSITSRNTSGRVGVHWAKDQELWCASIGYKKEHKNLGYFSDFNEAVKVREEAEKKYFGEYNPNKKEMS